MRLLLVIFVAILWATCFAVKIRRLPEVCFRPNNLGADIKNCAALEERWYLSENSGWCKPHKYSNCSKSNYGFLTEAECKEKCEKQKHQKHLCHDQPHQERCRASFTRFYWNVQEGCKMYTGCYRGGFATSQECRKKCGNGSKRFRPGSGIGPKLGV